MTQESIEMAKQAGFNEQFADVEYDWPRFEAFAKLVAEKEREANAKMVDHILKEGGGTWGDAIRAMGAIRSIEAKLKQKNGYAEEKNAICSPFMISELWKLHK